MSFGTSNEPKPQEIVANRTTRVVGMSHLKQSSKKLLRIEKEQTA